MSIKIAVAVAILSLGLTAVQAYAETEGSGDPFAFRATAQASTARPVFSDTGSEAFPQLTGEMNQQPSVAQMAAASGSEMAVQTTNSLPHGFEEGTTAYAQAETLKRYAAGRQVPIRVASAEPSRR